MSKRTLIGVVAVLIGVNAAVAVYFLVLRQPGPSKAKALFLNRVVQISGSVEACGLVQEYREGRSILLQPLDEPGQAPVLLPLTGSYRITVVAQSAEAFRASLRAVAERQTAELAKKRAEDDRLARLEQESKQELQKEETVDERERDKLRHEEARVMLAKGVGYVFNNDLQKAFDSLYRAEELDNANFQTSYLIGLIKFSTNDISGAESYFSKTILLNEDFIPAYFFRGLAASLNGDHALAVQDLVKASQSFNFMQRISDKQLKEGRVRIAGGEIQMPERKEGADQPKQMTIDGKVHEYTPVDGGGFMGTALSPNELKQAVTYFLNRASREDKLEVFHSACRSVFVQLQQTMEEGKSKPGKGSGTGK